MRCKNCGKIMKSDTENRRYICECGEFINWFNDREESKLYALYF